MTALTSAQLRALRWIDENEHTRSGWNSSFKTLTLSGDTGSIKIPVGDVNALLPYIAPGTGRRVHALNAKGQSLLAEPRP